MCTDVINRYRSPRLSKTSAAIFLVFGKCGVISHRLYRYSLTLKSFHLLLLALLGLIDTLCRVASLKVPAMIVYNMATKALGTEEFPKHNIADLNPGITFIVLFTQEMPLR